MVCVLDLPSITQESQCHFYYGLMFSPHIEDRKPSHPNAVKMLFFLQSNFFTLMYAIILANSCINFVFPFG